MDRAKDPWSTRQNSISTPNAKRFTSLSSNRNGLSNHKPTASVTSPTMAGTPSFGLGSGAFASFGAAAKTSKTALMSPNQPDRKDDVRSRDFRRPPTFSKTNSQPPADETLLNPTRSKDLPWAMKNTWVIWYRPPTSRYTDYEKSTKPMCRMATVQQFWVIYQHLRHPSTLPTVSDYHFFKEGIRPVWEDEENKKGGKWIMRLKKGVADRYWEQLLLAMIGDQFGDAGEEVCGAVVSVRIGEDVVSVWTKNDGGRNVKIRETIKRVLDLPADTNLVWKSHDESMAPRPNAEQSTRHEKSQLHIDKRRTNLTDDIFNKEAIST